MREEFHFLPEIHFALSVPFYLSHPLPSLASPALSAHAIFTIETYEPGLAVALCKCLHSGVNVCASPMAGFSVVVRNCLKINRTLDFSYTS